MLEREVLEATGYLVPGMGVAYAAARPQPPAALLDAIVDEAGGGRPQLVVDLGRGTGLSTFAWADRSEAVVGVEPSDEMRAAAEAAPVLWGDENVTLRAGGAAETGVESGSADVVTVGSAFHFMEPVSTLGEVDRVLRPGGVLAIYGHEGLPAIEPELDAANVDYVQSVARRFVEVPYGDRQVWPPSTFVESIEASGYFEGMREETFEHEEVGTAARVLDLVHTVGEVALVRASSEDDFGSGELLALAERVIGPGALPWTFACGARFARKRS